MRPIKMTDAAKALFMEQFMSQARKTLEGYNLESNVSVEMNLDMDIKDKVVISYTPGAYLKCQELVRHFTGEVGWYGLVERVNDFRFRVYDVLVPEQKVNGGRVVDDTVNTDWYDSLTNDQLNHLFFHAHSHVNMGTSPSDTDTAFQRNVVDSMNGEGFYVFQIWNKPGDINTFVYDLDNNAFYGRNDVSIEVELEGGTLKGFIDEADEKVRKIDTNPFKPIDNKSYVDKIIQYNPESRPFVPAKDFDKIAEEAKKSLVTRPGFYWNDGMGREGYD